MLKDKVAIVTGSTSGIGLGMAEALAAQGCHVMLNGLGDAKEAEGDRARLAESYGVEVAYERADLSAAAGVEALVKRTEERFGQVDVLVNNAGLQHVSPVDRFPPEQWDRIIAINLSAAFHGIRLVVPGMRARGWGRIVNTASVHGLVASVDKAAYVASKHGLVGLTKVVGLELAGSGVTCNAICPGWTHTALIQAQIEKRAAGLGVSVEEGGRALLAEKQPSKQFVTVEQLGALLVFLCSDAAAQITGAALPVDGGWTAQ